MVYPITLNARSCVESRNIYPATHIPKMNEINESVMKFLRKDFREKPVSSFGEITMSPELSYKISHGAVGHRFAVVSK